jgi:hypothetical protein
MTRRRFIAAGGGVAIAAAGVGYNERWLTRRMLIRAGVSLPPRNRLRNADFAQITNAPVPDYWGANPAAGENRGALAFAVDANAPFAGVRSIRLTAGPSGGLTVQAHPTFVPAADAHTLSAHFRGDADGRRAHLRLGWGGGMPVEVGREWRRAHVTYEPRAEASRRRALEARFSISGPGTVWIAAPQLEVGSAPSAFATALIDDHPLPALSWNPDEQWSPAFVERGVLAGLDAAVLSAIAVDHPTDADLSDIAAHGFDAVVLFVPAAGADGEFARDTLRVVPMLDAAARQRLRVIAFLTHRAIQSVPELTKSVVRTIRLLNAHSAIVAWLVLDEPSRLWESPPWADLCALSAEARAAAAGRTVFVNDNACRDEGAGLLSASDLGSADVYPVGQYANSLKPFADLSSAINRASARARKPAAMWLQMYGFDDAVREPTPEEARAMSYATFIHGTRLLCHWIYKPMNLRLWDSMKTVHQEIRSLADAVSQADARCVRIGTRRGCVHYGVWTTGRRTFVAACNISPDGVIAGIDVPEARQSPKCDGWYEAPAAYHARNTLWSHFPPLSRQVWELR